MTTAVTRAADIDPFLRGPDVMRLLGLKKSTFYALVQNKGFPPGVRITRGCVGWRRSVVIAFMAERERAAA